MNAYKLCTVAWLLIGMRRSEPGILKLDGGRLTFISDEQGRVFDASLAEVTNVKFPWYYFGGGLKLQIGSVEYRLSFIEPDDSSISLLPKKRIDWSRGRKSMEVDIYKLMQKSSFQRQLKIAAITVRNLNEKIK